MCLMCQFSVGILLGCLFLLDLEVPGIGFRRGIELPWNYGSRGIELDRLCQWNELEHRCMVCWSACFKPTATSCCGSVYCERCIRRIVHNTKRCPACYKRLIMKKLVRLYVNDMRCCACREWQPFAAPVATTTCGHVFCRHCLQDNCPICGRRLHERDILDLDLEDAFTAYIHFL